ncbi:FixH family protein [Owenweeksia hongkongensis]|nr:FixH family protein [Owenweeksia hongkongensis]
MKTLNKWATMALTIGLSFQFSACDKDDDSTTPPKNNDALSSYVLAGEQSTSSADVKLYFGEDAFVGYNHVAVRLTESGTDNMIENATVSFLPMMDMGTMMHSAPFSNPTFDVDMDAYMGSSTFIMPSGTMGSWTFSVLVEVNGGSMDTATFTIEVEAKQEAKLYNFKSALNDDTYFVALKEPMAPEVGLNDFEVMVYKRETMMSFPPATDLKIEIEPEMPSMGHGSPNNENPTHVGDGLYSGKVNFTMTGYWKVNMKIMDAQDSVIKADGFFDITFQ